MLHSGFVSGFVLLAIFSTCITANSNGECGCLDKLSNLCSVDEGGPLTIRLKNGDSYIISVCSRLPNDVVQVLMNGSQPLFLQPEISTPTNLIYAGDDGRISIAVVCGDDPSPPSLVYEYTTSTEVGLRLIMFCGDGDASSSMASLFVSTLSVDMSSLPLSSSDFESSTEMTSYFPYSSNSSMPSSTSNSSMPSSTSNSSMMPSTTSNSSMPSTTSNSSMPSTTSNSSMPSTTSNSSMPSSTSNSSMPSTTSNSSMMPSTTSNSSMPSSTSNSSMPSSTSNSSMPSTTSNSSMPSTTSNSSMPFTDYTASPTLSSPVLPPPTVSLSTSNSPRPTNSHHRASLSSIKQVLIAVGVTIPTTIVVTIIVVVLVMVCCKRKKKSGSNYVRLAPTVYFDDDDDN